VRSLQLELMNGFPNECRARWQAIAASYLFAFLTFGALEVVGRGAEPAEARSGEFDVQIKFNAELGGEHIAHAIYRRGPDGGSIVGWGERIVEWQLAQPELHEVTARQGDLRFYNGGCALDVNGDGVDEIVVARGKTRAGRDPELLWCEELAGAAHWSM
jgi:hypothetical protein